MDQQANIQREIQPEAQSQPREELVQAIVVDIRQLFEEATSDEVLARFRQVHPVDQGEALSSLSEDIRRLILESLGPAETADILEELGLADGTDESATKDSMEPPSQS